MRLRISVPLFSFLLTAIGCLPPTPAPAGSAEWAIVNGERTAMNEQAVVSVRRGGGLCTGALIAPRVVLTAKHCVQSELPADSPSPPSSFVVGIGDIAYRPQQTFGVVDVWTPDGGYNSLLQGLIGEDVALLTLRSDAPIEPLRLFRGDPAELIGTEMKSVGFGETPDGDVGIKYRVMTTVSSYDADRGVINTPPSICQGDSGGPLITADGEVAGVASYGERRPCGLGDFGAYNDVVGYLEEITDGLREAGACTDDGAEVCDGGDNDCDGMVDETCLALGESCTSDDECLSLRCEETDAGQVCTQDCDPLRPLAGCGTGLYCARTDDGCEGRCELGDPGDLAIDAPCATATDCASLYCADPGDGVQRCLDPCVGDAGSCLFGEVCAAGPGICGGCVPEDLLDAPRGLGESCADAGECQSGDCLLEAGDGYCTRGCASDDDCGAGHHCRMMEDSASNRCVRGDRGGVGENCIDNLDCGEGLFCAERGTDAWCTRFCEVDDDCARGLSCIDVGGASLCAPDLGIVGSECVIDDDCISGLCRPVGARGANVCTRFCGIDSHCESGFACVRSEEGLDSVCIETESIPSDDGGGCAAGGAPPAGAAWWLFISGFFFFSRRKVIR